MANDKFKYLLEDGFAIAKAGQMTRPVRTAREMFPMATANISVPIRRMIEQWTQVADNPWEAKFLIS